MDTFLEFCLDDGVNHALTVNAGLAFKGLGHDLYPEVSFARTVDRGMTVTAQGRHAISMTGVTMGIIGNCQMNRGKGGGQFTFNAVAIRHASAFSSWRVAPRLVDTAGKVACRDSSEHSVPMVARKSSPEVLHPFGRPKKSSAEPTQQIHACAVSGCPHHGEHRAPRDRSLNQYMWLCLDHVREYNKRWNFYEGMSADEVEGEIRRDTCWQRPSWQLGTLGGRQGSAGGAKMKDGFGFFADDESVAGKRRAEWTREQANRRRAHDSDEDKALRFMDLDFPLTKEALKARYKELVKKYHPDVNQGDPLAEERLKDINEAYKTLLAGLNP